MLELGDKVWWVGELACWRVGEGRVVSSVARVGRGKAVPVGQKNQVPKGKEGPNNERCGSIGRQGREATDQAFDHVLVPPFLPSFLPSFLL